MMKFFYGLLLDKRCQTRNLLRLRELDINAYPICENDEKDVNNSFMTCLFVKTILRNLNIEDSHVLEGNKSFVCCFEGLKRNISIINFKALGKNC